MKLVLHGRHYLRSLLIMTQRPSNISKTTRSQINVWYRCVKRFDLFGFMLFSKFEIQDMKDDLPVDFIKDDEGREFPNGKVTNYFVNKRNDPVFRAYNTHAMRQADALDVKPEFEGYELSRMDIMRLIMRRIFSRRGAAIRGAAAP